MTSLLLFIKHHCSWVWIAIEWMNGWLFRLFNGKMDEVAAVIFKEYKISKEFGFSLVKGEDIVPLSLFLKGQPKERLLYFQPHAFNEQTLSRLLRNNAFLMMKVTDNEDNRIIGYFFLRCFFVGNAFHGFIVDKEREGLGIGATMMKYNLAICQQKHLRLFSTVSSDNVASQRSSEKVADICTTKRLNNGYMLIEWSTKTT